MMMKIERLIDKHEGTIKEIVTSLSDASVSTVYNSEQVV